MAIKHFCITLVTSIVLAIAMLTPLRAEPYKIVAFGDSLTAGYGLQPGESFPEKLQIALKAKGHDIVVENAGVSGDTTSGGLSRLDWSVPDDARMVILELGANDMLRGVAPELTERNLDKAITRLKTRNVNILLAGMRAAPNFGPEFGKAFDGIFPRLAQKHQLALYPFFLDGVAADKAYLLEDGMHPNAKGVDRIVERILPEIEAMLAANKPPI